jgi:hypothetical protein
MQKQKCGFKAGMVLLVLGLMISTISCSDSDQDSDKFGGEAKTDNSKYINPVVYELVMNELMRSSEKWNGLDQTIKVRAVEGFLLLLKTQEKANIQKPADYYVGRLDEMLQQNPRAAQNIPTLLKMMAVMDYDFDNGQDKEQLAKDYLGKLYEANKARLAANPSK